jgi:hypothetical protein
MPYTEQIIFQSVGADGVIADRKNIDLNAKDSGQSIKNTYDNTITPAIARNKTTTDAFVGAIRNERQERRLATFAVREGAGAIGQMSEALGGASGLNKVMTSGIGQVIEMKGALSLLGQTTSNSSGIVGTLGAGIASMALPIAAAIAGFVIIKGILDDDDKKMKENAESIKKLKQELGLIPADSLKSINEEIDKLNKKGPDISVWTHIWKATLDAMLGTHLNINQTIEESDEKTKAGLEL